MTDPELLRLVEIVSKRLVSEDETAFQAAFRENLIMAGLA